MNYPEGGLFPEWVWVVMSDLGLFVAIVALLSALGYLWHNGPGLLIKYGPRWMTKLGLHWNNRRTDDEDA